MFTPDRKKLFEDIEPSEQCSSVACSSLRFEGGEVGKTQTAYCVATAHGECPRVNNMAQELNQFIADNDDVFMYIQPVGE